MNTDEIGTVLSIVRKIQPKLGTGHATERATERKVSEDEICKALANGKVIEVSRKENGDVRTLIRWDGERCSIVVCISLRTGFVCTAWKNNLNDTHKTIDMGIYTWKQELTAIL